MSKRNSKYMYTAAVSAAVIWGIFFIVAKISLIDFSVPNIIAYRGSVETLT